MKRIIFVIFLLLILGGALYVYVSRSAQNPIENTTVSNIINKKPEKSADITKLSSKLLNVPNKYAIDTFKENRFLNLPDGFEISVFAAGLDAPRALAFDNEGGIYVSDKGAGKVYYLTDSNKDNVADSMLTVDQDLRNVHGVEYTTNTLYVAEEHQVVVYRGIKGNEFVRKEILIPNLPSDGGHVTRTLRVGPDNKLYVSIGSSCNVCEESDTRRAAIMRYNLDGTGEQVFAKGLRNTVDFIFDDENKIWGVDNGRDNLGDNTPPEEVNIIQTGNHYGWPYCYGNRIANPEFLNQQTFCDDGTKGPEFEMQAHSAPLGLTFGPWDSLEEFLFIAFHGSWNRSVPTGYKVVAINTDAVNPKTIDFISGWLENNGEAWGRPVDVKVYDGNKLLITDDAAGAIYIVTKN